MYNIGRSLKGEIKVKSIKTKFVFILGVLVIVVCSGLGVVGYSNSVKALYTTAEELSTKTVAESARVVEARINTRFMELLAIANTEKIMDATISNEEKMEYLKKEAKRGGYLSFGLGNAEGETLTMAGAIINLKERPYYQEALQGKAVITDPIISREDNTTLLVNYAVPIHDKSGKVMGVLIGARYGDELSAITNDIVLGDTGKAFMINQLGTTVAHENQEVVKSAENMIEKAEADPALKSLANIMNKMITGEMGFGEYSYQGVSQFVAFAPVTNTSWFLAITVPKTEILSTLDSLKIGIFIASIIFLLMGFVVSYLIASFFSRQIKALANDLNIISKGDFSNREVAQIKNGKDEIAQTYQSMTTMKTSVSGMIKAIKDTAGSINNDSQSLNTVAEQMSATSDSVATAIQETAQGVSSQARGLADINGALYAFGNKLEDIVTNIVDIDISAKDINDMSNKGSQDMQHLIQSINMMGEAFKDFTNKMGSLNQNINKVTEITNLINSIAQQTNLLALNAAIEAARAGESGRGFSVVAEEIRKLAEQSQDSSQNINRLIGNITGDADSIIETTNSLDKELDTQVNVINNVTDSYKNIVKAIQDIGARIQLANSAAIEINNEKTTILARVEDASAVSQQVAASSEEISAASEQMTASAQEVAQSAKNMTVLVGNMLGQVDQFKI